MRKTRSLRRTIIYAVMFFGTLLVLGYTTLLLDFGERGLDLAVEIRLDMEKRAYSKKYAEDPNTPLPSYTNFKTYLNYASLPQDIRDTIPAEEMSPQQMTVYDPLDQDIMQFIYPWQRPDDKWVFFIFTVQLDESTDRILQDLDVMFSLIGEVGLTVLTIIVILILALLHHISRAINELREWANGLQLKTLDQQRRIFKYRELDQLADLIYNNTKRIAKGIEREQRFLEHASHELRTPIAILQNNLELMEYKGLDKDPRFAASFNRMSTSVHNMHHLTTTLLWASRKETNPPQISNVQLKALIEELISENTYLLNNKSVQIHTVLSDERITASKHVLRIILGNIIRNAFQHTYEGEISIHNTADTFVVFNTKTIDHEESTTDSYGLGIMLIERLVTKMGWDIIFDNSEDFFSVTLQMNSTAMKTQTDNQKT